VICNEIVNWCYEYLLWLELKNCCASNTPYYWSCTLSVSSKSKIPSIVSYFNLLTRKTLYASTAQHIVTFTNHNRLLLKTLHRCIVIHTSCIQFLSTCLPILLQLGWYCTWNRTLIKGLFTLTFRTLHKLFQNFRLLFILNLWNYCYISLLVAISLVECLLGRQIDVCFILE